MRMKGYPRWFYTMLLCLMAALFVSGGMLIPTVLEFKLEYEIPWRLESEQLVPVTALHAALSFAMLTILGALWSIHIRSGWRRKKNLYSGLTLLLAMLLLTLSAIGIYYLGDGDASIASSILHSVIGVLTLVVFFIHDRIGRHYHIRHASGH